MRSSNKLLVSMMVVGLLAFVWPTDEADGGIGRVSVLDSSGLYLTECYNGRVFVRHRRSGSIVQLWRNGASASARMVPAQPMTCDEWREGVR